MYVTPDYTIDHQLTIPTNIQEFHTQNLEFFVYNRPAAILESTGYEQCEGKAQEMHKFNYLNKLFNFA